MNIAMIPDVLLTSIRTKIFSISDIELYINSLIEFLDIKDFYEGIILDDIRNGNLASYNFKTHKIRIYYRMLKSEGCMQSNRLDFNDPVLVTNMLIIESILHEIFHLYQNAVAHKCNYPIYHIYQQQLLYTDSCSDKDYSKFYSSFIYEREAQTSSLENCLRIIRYIIKDANLFYEYMEHLRSNIICSYKLIDGKLISPLEFFYKEAYETEAPIVEYPDNYQRLKLGLPVSKNQYNIFKKNYQNIIIRNNDLNI